MYVCIYVYVYLQSSFDMIEGSNNIFLTRMSARPNHLPHCLAVGQMHLNGYACFICCTFRRVIYIPALTYTHMYVRTHAHTYTRTHAGIQ